MTRSFYKTLATLLWLAPLVICIRYWQVWDRLPARMATHFNAAGHANGWMTREVSLYWSAGFLALMAGIFFTVLFVLAAKYPLTKLSWTLIAFLLAETAMFLYLQNSLLEYNLGKRQIAVAPLVVVSVVGLVALAAVALGEKQGEALARTEIVAEEVHSGRKQSAILLLVPLSLVPGSLAVPSAAVRIAMIAIAVIMLAAFAMAWDGFHYYFTRHGVEIRTLGFRLKSIPLLQIKSYETENWNALRGYGIRGVGNTKAYVWGKAGVRVDLYDGSVFLGHSNPQRIVHDLNAIKRYQNS